MYKDEISVKGLLSELVTVSHNVKSYEDDKGRHRIREIQAGGKISASFVKPEGILLLNASRSVPANVENCAVRIGELTVLMLENGTPDTDTLNEYFKAVLSLSCAAGTSASLKAQGKHEQAGITEKLVTGSASRTENYLRSMEKPVTTPPTSEPANNEQNVELANA